MELPEWRIEGASAQVELMHGTVTACGADFFLLAVGGVRIKVRKASGCLLIPEPGDLVLASRCGDGEAYILTVLEKYNPERSTVSFPGDVLIDQKERGIRLCSGKRLRVQSSDGVDIDSRQLNIQTREGTLLFDSFSCSGRKGAITVERLSAVVVALESKIGKMVQFIRRSFRTITDLDQTKAGRCRYRAEESVDIAAKRATIKTKDSLAMDSEHIFLG